MSEPTPEQMRCGRAIHGDPAICTCGTCGSIPAPWHVDPDDREDMEFNNHILAANGNTVCFMAWSGDPENNDPHEKAARLIATAPDMLAALIDLRKTAALLQQNAEGCAVNHYGSDIELNGLPGWLADTQKSIQNALAVIAKATS